MDKLSSAEMQMRQDKKNSVRISFSSQVPYPCPPKISTTTSSPLGRTVRYVAAAAAAAGVGIGWNKQIFDLSHSSFCECPVPRLRALFYHRPRWMRIRIVGQWVSKNNPPQSNSFTSFSAAPSTAMDEGTILALVMRTIRMKKWFLSLEDLNCQIRDFYLQFQLY